MAENRGAQPRDTSTHERAEQQARFRQRCPCSPSSACVINETNQAAPVEIR